MSETETEKWVRETNEKPMFFLQERQVFKRGGASITEDGKASFGMNFPVLEINEFIKEPEDVVDILNKGWSCECKNNTTCIAETQEEI